MYILKKCISLKADIFIMKQLIFVSNINEKINSKSISEREINMNTCVCLHSNLTIQFNSGLDLLIFKLLQTYI